MKKVLILFFILSLFLIACSNEELKIEKISNNNLAELDIANESNTTKIVEVIPKYYSDNCKPNNKINVYKFEGENFVCTEDNLFILTLENVGFDIIDSIKIKKTNDEITTESNTLKQGNRKKYKFDLDFFKGVEEIEIIPRGIFENKAYDCVASKIKVNIERPLNCEKLINP